MSDKKDGSTEEKKQADLGETGTPGAHAAGHFAICGAPVFIGAQQAQQQHAPYAGNYAICGAPVFIGAQQTQQTQQAGQAQSIPIGIPGGGSVTLNFFMSGAPGYSIPAAPAMPSTSGPTQTIDTTQSDIENRLEYLKRVREQVAQQLEQIVSEQMRLQREKNKQDAAKKG